MTSALASVAEIVDEIRAGRMVILIDDEDRENEGDVILAADFVTPEAINFMVTHCRGLVCLALTEARCRQLGLEQMVVHNRTPHGTAFTASIEAASGVTTGISAHDRAHTVQVAVSRNARPQDIVMPGHIFPLTARNGGVLIRAGHTEAGCDLAQLAGLEPAAVICEILKADGSMARLPDLIEFAKEHGLKIGAVRDLIEYRVSTERLVERVAEKAVENVYGAFTMRAFRDTTSGDVHFALSKGEIDSEQETIVRVHEAISFLDILAPDSTQHSVVLSDALHQIASVEQGVLVLLYRPQSGLDLLDRFHGHSSSARWDPRLSGVGAQILRDLNVRRMRLMMSTPQHIPNMTGFGLEIAGFVGAEQGASDLPSQPAATGGNK